MFGCILRVHPGLTAVRKKVPSSHSDDRARVHPEPYSLLSASTVQAELAVTRKRYLQ